MIDGQTLHIIRVICDEKNTETLRNCDLKKDSVFLEMLEFLKIKVCLNMFINI